MQPVRLPLRETLAALPAEWPEDLFARIQAEARLSREKVVVLDDDPTGAQGVYDVAVLTDWTIESLGSEFENELPAVYLSTNTRSFLLPKAQAINLEIGRNLAEVRRRTGRSYKVVSRSDSTLRGHFPGEVEALEEGLQDHFDAWIIVPFLLAGGRYTIGDVHYVAEGKDLVPVGETQFAQDATFGFRSSRLQDWVAEKTHGRVSAADVASITLEDIRLDGPNQVTQRLLALPAGAICIVNAASMRDIAVVVRGLQAAEKQGKRYLYRTAASIVPLLAGIEPRPLLTKDELDLPEQGGGLFIVGSYVPKTTAQVEQLLALPGIVAAEIRVPALLELAARDAEIERVVKLADEALRKEKNVVIYTSRELITGADASKSLGIGQQVSAALVSIVRAISERPRYILAKGGITSSDIAVQGLSVSRALVLGQIQPAVTVWRTGEESRFPGLAYIVFPGNVGGPSAVADVCRMLDSSATRGQ